MMGPGFADAAFRGIGQLFLLFAGVAFITGAAVMWGLPQLWHWFHPILLGWLS